MVIKLNTVSSTPIYVQLRNQIVLGIGCGELEVGERLPTVRQMAQDIGVNTLTVQKAYEILKIEGYIEIDRRHGARVNPAVNLSGQFQEKIEHELTLLVSESLLKGMSRDDFMDLCGKVFNRVSFNKPVNIT